MFALSFVVTPPTADAISSWAVGDNATPFWADIRSERELVSPGHGL